MDPSQHSQLEGLCRSVEEPWRHEACHSIGRCIEAQLCYDHYGSSAAASRVPNGVGPANHRRVVSDALGISDTASANGSMTSSLVLPPHPQDDFDDEYTDDTAQSVTYGRLVQGHIVDDDYPSPSLSTAPHGDDPMLASITSLHSLHNGDALGGSIEAQNSDDEDDVNNPVHTERMITLVGDVKNRVVLILDDMIDSSSSWIAAAEHCKKRGGAHKVICLATHGIFGGDCLREMDACECIDQIVVTNSFPIEESKIPGGKATGLGPSGAGTRGKLTVIDLSVLLSEAIRRNHNGESISALFQHYQD